MNSSGNTSTIHENGDCTYCVNFIKGVESVKAVFDFFGNFDSANLGTVEYGPYASTSSVQTPETSASRPSTSDRCDLEFKIWTKPDCYRTQYQNLNRTWFNFGIQASTGGLIVKLHLIDLNRQSKMYSQGMTPVYRIMPAKPNWERIRDKPSYMVDENTFSISFKYKTPENIQSVVYFAFTYPFPYEDLNFMLIDMDAKFLNLNVTSKDDIYFLRETVCLSLDGRKVDLLTISSRHNISTERETRLKCLFPDYNIPRPFRFIHKKVIFVSARVHPGETPSSFVFNGLLKLLLNREDPVAIALRRLYVFKMIPMLNPDGVVRGHYRTDTRGVNLNRMYLNPSMAFHPSIYAARALIRYYNYGYEKEDEPYDANEDLGRDGEDDDVSSVDDHSGPAQNTLSTQVSNMTLEENRVGTLKTDTWCSKWCRYCGIVLRDSSTPETSADINQSQCEHGDYVVESGLYMYIDMHGHASKKGIFMYGNHFANMEKNIECMLLPKLMSINNHNFHFSSCNFTERNMYLRDRHDGMSREGCGRVAVLKLTGLIYSYTLECNYNTGRIVNALPPTIKETGAKHVHTLPVPPKYTPHTFEQIGRALGPSILDLTGNNPITRLPNSQFHTLDGLREWLSTQCTHDLGTGRYVTSKYKSSARNSVSLQAQGKTVRGVIRKSRPSGKAPKRMGKTVHAVGVAIERKENICARNDKITSKPKPVGLSTKLAASSINAKPTPTMKNTKIITKRDIGTITLAKIMDKTRADNASSQVEVAKEGKLKNSDSSLNSRIQEICLVRGTEGKRVIAKYKTKGKKMGSEDNLVVSWDSTNTPQVFSYRTRGPGMPALKSIGAPGPSNKVGCFRVHNFAKSATKLKRNKRPLRRLTTTIDTQTKSEPIRKRKLFKRSSAP